MCEELLYKSCVIIVLYDKKSRFLRRCFLALGNQLLITFCQLGWRVFQVAKIQFGVSETQQLESEICTIKQSSHLSITYGQSKILTQTESVPQGVSPEQNFQYNWVLFITVDCWPKQLFFFSFLSQRSTMVKSIQEYSKILFLQKPYCSSNIRFKATEHINVHN